LLRLVSLTGVLLERQRNGSSFTELRAQVVGANIDGLIP
jgi:hypothetical protein